MNPSVSICIPTFNGATYLAACLDSALAQSFADFEILIVDDRSSDETLTIAKEYATRDRRIRLVVNEKNLGLGGNWNRCVELAQGEWIKFVFQDDSLEPGCLERMLAARTPDTVMISSRRSYIFDPSVPEVTQNAYLRDIAHFSLAHFFHGKTDISAKDYCAVTLNHLGDNFVGEPTGLMLHRSVFYRFGVFNPYLIHSCDFEFWTRVAVHTGIIYVPETLTRFRVHPDSASASNKGPRKYRAFVLDELVLLHDYAFHPVYAPLRAAAADHRPAVDLAKWLSTKSHAARRIAERAAVHPVNPTPHLLAEWNELLQSYPLLGQFSQRSLVTRLTEHGCEWPKHVGLQVKAFFKLARPLQK
jgi:glycosyltransferase involved in cell wall biosynthesis